MTDQLNDNSYDPHAARHAAEVLRKKDFYHDENGDYVGAPTNLTVDGDGMVHDATGAIVGRAGEVFVDANGNAINAEGKIVGQATRPINAILDDARTGAGRTATLYVIKEESRPEPVTSSPEPITTSPLEFTPDSSDTVITKTESEINMSENLVPAEYAAPGYQNEAAREAEEGYVGGAGYGAGNDGGEYEGTDPRNKYLDGPDGVAQNRYGDGVYGAGDTFASRAFGQNHDTEMLDHSYNEKPEHLFGINDVDDAGEIPNVPDGAQDPYGTAQRPHYARNVTTGESVATNLTVDSDGNVYDAAGNYAGKAVEVVADANGDVLNSAGYVVGRTI